MKLYWGNEEDLEGALAFNNHQPFNIIVGSELIYYRTDMNLLVQTVNRLSGPSTIFIHAHVIRENGKGTELVNLLEKEGFDTYECNIKDIVDDNDLANNPGFYQVRTLLSVPRDQKDKLLKAMIGTGSGSSRSISKGDVDVDNSFLKRFVENSAAQGGSDDAEEEENVDNIFDALMF